MPNNCTISVVSSLCFEDVYKIIDKYFSTWKEKKYENNEIVYEKNTCGTFIEEKSDINSCKIQYIFPIHNLNHREITLLRIFNSFFGEGTSSILYDEIRTKRGLVYDISSKLKNENGIKLYTITLGTSKENINTSIEIINDEIEKVKVLKRYFTEGKIEDIIKSLKLKRILGLEKSISLSFNICIFDIMYGDYNILFNEYDIEDITEDEILKVANKVLNNSTIQIIKSK
ncbi:M16 family metallopeptidase [Clostridium sp. UBA2485]|uniref:M16 family metallopeptidase n=1 Tax=Clostridium sp. UBA2485 TaxID=1946352 RepID=UPI0032E4100D